MQPTADLGQGGPLGRLALTIARRELGVAEVPPGSNRGRRVDVYLLGVHRDGDYLLTPAGSRWCGRFARWCFETAAAQLAVVDLFRGWGDLASALKWRDQGKLHRCWVATPAPGRVGLHLEESGHGHVALVTEVNGGRVTTIAGNEANAVRSIERPVEYFTGGFVELG